MPHRIDPAMESMQAPRRDAAGHTTLVDSHGRELPVSHDTVLASRDYRDLRLCRGELLSHTESKAPRTLLLPLEGSAPGI